jgi:diaminohydroxyphosphoribosylaminopyrimidine deaminase/5-amino-6-(5-phosphoribosylamino)uracil reductase
MLALILLLAAALALASKAPGVLSNANTDARQAIVDEKHLRRALELAAQALGKTSPNPCVGCVLADGATGEVVGEGWHVKAGEPHAEAMALARAGERARGCTAYVSLEPCNHFGRTPPCSHALLKHGIARVVVGMVDPDARVSGSGIAHLLNAGVPVTLGVSDSLYQACRNLNRPFLHRVTTDRSYLCLALPAGTTTSDLGQILPQLLAQAPEVDALLLTSRQLLKLSAAALHEALLPHTSLLVWHSGSEGEAEAEAEEEVSKRCLAALQDFKVIEGSARKLRYLPSTTSPTLTLALKAAAKQGCNGCLLVHEPPTKNGNGEGEGVGADAKDAIKSGLAQKVLVQEESGGEWSAVSLK